MLTVGSLSAEERTTRREEARAVVEAAEDHEGLALYWWSVAGERWNLCRAEDAVAACERGLFHTARSRAPGRTEDLTWWICAAYVNGPTPVEEGDRTPRDASEGAGGRHPPPGRRDERSRPASGHERRRRAGTRDARYVPGRRSERPASTRRPPVCRWVATGSRSGQETSRRRSRLFATASRSSTARTTAASSSTVAASIALFAYLRGDLDETDDSARSSGRRPPRTTSSTSSICTRSRGACWRKTAGCSRRSRRHVAALELADTTDFFFARARARLYLAVVLARAGRMPRRLTCCRRTRGARGQRRRDRTHVGARGAGARRGHRAADRRRRTLLTSLHGDRVPPGSDRTPRRARAEVRQGGAHVRRRAPPSGRVARPPERRLDDHATDAVDLAEHPDRLGGDGHGDRGAPCHRAGAGGGSRHRPPQPLDRGSGRGGRQGEALGVGDDRRAGHAPRRQLRRRGARAHGALPHLGRPDHRRRRRPRRHPHEPRPPLRDRHVPARLRADDEPQPRHRAGRDDPRGGRGDPPPQQDREAPGRRRRRPAQGTHHRQGHLEAHQVPGCDEGRPGPSAGRCRGRRRVRTRSSALPRSSTPRSTSSSSTPRTAIRTVSSTPCAAEGQHDDRSDRGEHRDRRRRARARRRRRGRREGRDRAGSICTTRVVAGVGVPQITAVYDAVQALAGRASR